MLKQAKYIVDPLGAEYAISVIKAYLLTDKLLENMLQEFDVDLAHASKK